VEHGNLLIHITANGLPLKDADVTVTRVGFDSTMRFRSPPGGVQQLAQLPLAEFFIHAEHPDYLPGEAFAVIRPGPPAVVKIQMGPGGRISGRVTDTGGNPLPDTFVILVDAKSHIMITNLLSTRSGPDGRYRLPAIPPGSYGVRFRHDKFKMKDRYEYTFLNGTESYEVDAQLEVGAMAAGRVVDESGAPLPGVRIQVMGQKSVAFGESDAQGRWEGHGLLEGPLSVTAQKAGFGTTIVRNLPPNSTGVEIRLLPAARVSGRVEADDPPEEFMISLERFEPDLGRAIRTQVRLFGGPGDPTFAFEDLPPGAYDVIFEHDSFEALERPRIDVAAGGKYPDLRIRLRRK
jgi:hypothetical protein